MAAGKAQSDEAQLFVYTPYEVQLCGPKPPDELHTRWPDLVSVYTQAVISQLVMDDDGEDADDGAAADDGCDGDTSYHVGGGKLPVALIDHNLDPGGDDARAMDRQLEGQSRTESPEQVHIRPELLPMGLDEDIPGQPTEMSIDTLAGESQPDSSGTEAIHETEVDMDPQSGPRKPISGMSYLLSKGACGISHTTFLGRCLEEGRNGLFILDDEDSVSIFV
ncbi:unnamed protein product [Protopolystoma xenopodis]|uniref:Uncharacterized protein n=1 Tax=Protopolystoma xenopodis TaxID=117903 RepID=A0A448WF18_9PLAT|nr:unnamed protein product [Protopolystoma xenopodis]